MSAWGAMAWTGIFLLCWTIAWGCWVSEQRGASARRWHRPFVTASGTLTIVAFVAAAWMAVQT